MRRFFSPGVYSRCILFAVAAALIAIVNCDQVDVTAVAAARIELSPPTTSVAVSQTTRLTATVLSSAGQTLTGRTVQWSSLATGTASVDHSGMVRGEAPGVAMIRAVSGSASATASVTVTAPPTIALAPTEVTFTAVQNGSTPGDRTVGITNSGSSTLSGLSTAIRYGTGTPTGWLTATLSNTTAPTTLILSANQGSRTPGTYTATVDVTSPASTASLTVRLTVTPPGQAIALSATTIAFGAPQGGADPAAQTVGVTNAGGGALTGLSTAITYGAGQSSGWLSATLSTTTAPATLTLRAGASGLPTGVYNATVGVSSPIAQNTPQNISVTFTIGGAQPAIAVVPRLLGFSAVRGTANPPAQNLDVTNVGGASLTGLAVSVTYPGQQPGGWLTSSVSQGTAPATITVSATTGSLPTGTYTAALGVTSPVAMNSPQTVDVTFNVLEPPPSTPATLSATPVSPAQINLAWAAASGVVVRYRIERKTGAAGTYAVIDSVASSATTYNNTGLSSATLYGYRVRACNTTGCSTPTAEANATSLPIPPAGLTPTTASTTQINLSWTTSAGTVTNYRVERSATSGTGFAEIGTVTGTAYQSTGLTAATPYFYQLRACNAGGCSAYTPQSTAVTLPGAPTGLVATTTSSTQINLMWTATTGTVDSYRLERSTTTATGFAEIASVSNITTTQSNTGLIPNTRYFYRLRACNAGGCGAYTAEAAASTLPSAPAPPTGLGATTISSAQINLSWTVPTGIVDSLRLERSTASGSGFAEIASLSATATTFTNSGLAAGTRYFYRLRSCNAGGCSAYTPELAAISAPDPPSGALATAASATQINLSWTATTGVLDTYRVERSTTSGSGFAEITSVASGTTTFQNNTGLNPGTPYFYRLRACNAGGCSVYAAQVSALTMPAPPANLAATVVSATQINLGWTAAAGTVDNYRVERSTTTGTGFAEIASVTGTVFQSTSLTANTRYFYRARACHASGCSAYAAEVTAQTLPAPPSAPTGLSATAASATQINLSWTAAPAADSVHLERSTVSGSGFTLIASLAGTATTFPNTGLLAATQYFYRARACNAGGCSGYTSETSATTLTAPPSPAILPDVR